MNKKGSVIDIFVLIVFAFIIVFFFGVYIFAFNEMTTTLTSIDAGGSKLNVSDIAQDTFGQVNSAQITWLRVIAFVMIFGMMLTILLSNFLVKAHPVFFLVYVFVIIGAVMVSVELSNFYEDFLTDPLLGPTFLGFPEVNFILLFLPIYVTVVGFMGAIFLFAGILRDAGLGGAIT